MSQKASNLFRKQSISSSGVPANGGSLKGISTLSWRRRSAWSKFMSSESESVCDGSDDDVESIVSYIGSVMSESSDRDSNDDDAVISGICLLQRGQMFPLPRVRPNPLSGHKCKNESG